MQILQASATFTDDTFIHAGYGSAYALSRHDRATDKGGLAPFRAMLAMKKGEFKEYYYENIKDDSFRTPRVWLTWDAPLGYQNLNGVGIPLAKAFELAPTENGVTPAIGNQFAGTLSDQELATAKDKHVTHTTVMDMMGIIVLACFCGGLFVIGNAVRKKSAQPSVHALKLGFGLVLALLVPVLVLITSAKLNPGGVELSADNTGSVVKASGFHRHTPFAALNDEPVIADQNVEGLTYKSPELATMALMHGLIGHALYYVNQPVVNLECLQPFVAFPMDSEPTDGMVYATAKYGLDGWGGPFRIKTVKLEPEEVDEVLITISRQRWQTTVRSAGADGIENNEDDFVATWLLQEKEFGGERGAYFHYAVYICMEGDMPNIEMAQFSPTPSRHMIYPVQYSKYELLNNKPNESERGYRLSYNKDEIDQSIISDYQQLATEGVVMLLYPDLFDELRGQYYHAN